MSPGVLKMTFSLFARTNALAPDMQAPGFDLPDQHGRQQRLRDYRGHWVVVYFYPKDATPGCTTEACRLRDDILQLRAQGAQILGISLDSPESHAKFAEKHGLPFPLLADRGGQVAKRYGALFSLGPIRFARRHTFIVDPEGRIARVHRRVAPNRHSQQLTSDLRELQGAHFKAGTTGT